MTLDRGQLLADDRLTGSAWCKRHADLVDQWLAGLFQQAAGDRTEGVALVAVGGYGRAELCPRSDLDIMLLHHPGSDVIRLADAIWYPIWDAGVRLGHSVCTPREALRLAADDLDTATALLSAPGRRRRWALGRVGDRVAQPVAQTVAAPAERTRREHGAAA